jgi:phosphate starvation-inducible membrane PsiE
MTIVRRLFSKLSCVQIILYTSLLIAMITSCYIFIKVMVYESSAEAEIYSAWQFPMIFALFFEMMYMSSHFQNKRKL